MKIIKKRVLALGIDIFIFGIVFTMFIQSLMTGGVFLRGGVYLILFLPLFVKDSIFRNASIGKKILGIAIYDNDWSPPKFYILFKRAFLTYTVGAILFWKAMFVDGTLIHLIDWERTALGTRVIDLRVFKKLKADVKHMEGNSAQNMTELYNAYLRDLYLK